ncbi:hypothetical protein HCU40_17675 [Pseudanabaena biceps]|nr:hypothetical protein [Pseudanabaena biceps]
MIFTRFLRQFVVMVFISGLIVFANINPAIAENQSDQGMQILPNIQTKANNAVKESAYDSNPEYTSSDNSPQGLNEIQGASDASKMKRTINEKTPPIVKQVEKAITNTGDQMNSSKDNTLDKAGDATNFVKDNVEKAFDSLTGKAKDTAKSIKDKVKS